MQLVKWLPQVSYRQWTLSLPMTLRWAALREKDFLPRVERELVKAVWRWQRRAATRDGETERLQGAALSFLQLFGSSLQLTPHVHILIPEVQWTNEGKEVRLRPPDDAQVKKILVRVLRRLRSRLAELEEERPDDEWEDEKAKASQKMLFEIPDASPKKHLAFAAHGFSLHAGTHVKANDREGLERLCRYGARGPLTESRLKRRDDGKYEYRPKRGPGFVLDAEGLVRRIAALVPPEKLHLTRFHGTFAGNSKLRSAISAADPIASGASGQYNLTRKPKRTRSRIDWSTLMQRTWGHEVLRCPCGGLRKVLCLVNSHKTAEQVLTKFGMLEKPTVIEPGHSPPQASFQLA